MRLADHRHRRALTRPDETPSKLRRQTLRRDVRCRDDEMDGIDDTCHIDEDGLEQGVAQHISKTVYGD